MFWGLGTKIWGVNEFRAWHFRKSAKLLKLKPRNLKFVSPKPQILEKCAVPAELGMPGGDKSGLESHRGVAHESVYRGPKGIKCCMGP